MAKSKVLPESAPDFCNWSTPVGLLSLQKVQILMTKIFLSFGYLCRKINLIPAQAVG